MKKILLLMLVINLTSFTYAQLPNYVPTNGLVGWWPFNGNANDISGNGNNGIVNGATLVVDRFGNTNGAFRFNKNSIKINYNNSFTSQTGTISAWIFIDTLPTINDAQDVIFGKGWGYPQLLLRNNGKIYLSIMSSQSNTTFIESNSTLTIGSWNHIVGFYSNNNFKLYINGVLDNSITPQPLPTYYSYCNSEYWIGGFNHLNSCIPDENVQNFSGSIDDVAFWNRALTQQEITNLYNANFCYATITDTLIININRTSYNPITYSNTIKVYPNPSNNQITIDNGDLSKMNGYSIKIINSLGQQLYQTAINQQQNTVDITQWGGNGMYYLQVIDANGNIIEIKKIILQ